jgi:hypothetical protein
MRVVAFVDNPEGVEKVPRHLNLWSGPAAIAAARPPLASLLAISESDFQVEHDPISDCGNVITD